MKRKYLCEDGNGQFVLLAEQSLADLDELENVEIEIIEVEEIDKAELEMIMKPYPNEHSCELARGTRFSEYRSASRESGGKRYRILYGHIAGSTKWREAGYRYPKSSWRRDAAAGHCSRHSGRFVGATKAEKSEMNVEIRKADEEKGLVYGIVLSPYEIDTYKDFERPAEIEATAHRYLIHLGEDLKAEKVGVEHEVAVNAVPVESYIAPVEFWYDGTPHTEEYKVAKGAWVLVTKVLSKDVFEKIKSKEYTGYSVQGWGRREPVE